MARLTEKKAKGNNGVCVCDCMAKINCTPLNFGNASAEDCIHDLTVRHRRGFSQLKLDPKT